MEEFCLINIHSSAPLVAAAIHDGHELSENLARNSALTEAERLREEDPYTGVWAKICENHMIAQRSRFEFDLNRSPEKAIYILPSDAWGLSSLINKPGKIVILDLHSYNHRRGGPETAFDDPLLNPEINVGTGTMDRAYWDPVVDRFMKELGDFDFQGRKLDVRENVKFRGGYFPSWVDQNFKESACCISVEMKKFFMDEWSGMPDWETIDAIKNALSSTLSGLIEEITKKQTSKEEPNIL